MTSSDRPPIRLCTDRSGDRKLHRVEDAHELLERRLRVDDREARIGPTCVRARGHERALLVEQPARPGGVVVAGPAVVLEDDDRELRLAHEAESIARLDLPGDV